MAKKDDDLEPSESIELGDPSGGDDSGLVTFKVKYLGSTPVERSNNEKVTAEAIRTILRVAKAAGKKLNTVSLQVSLQGIKVTGEDGTEVMNVSIYR